MTHLDPSKTCPQTDRVLRRITAKNLLRRAIAQGVSVSGVAQYVSMTRQVFDRCLSVEDAKQLGLGDVIGLPPVCLRVIVDALCEQLGLVAVERPCDAPTVRDDVQHGAEILESAGATVARFAAALADGSISAKEAEVVLGAAEDLQRDASSLIERLRPVRAERVSAIRRAG